MKQVLVIVCILLAASLSTAQDISGDWNGTLKADGVELRLVLHITKNADGRLMATLDSTDQGANGIPVTSATVTNSHLSLNVDAVNGTYDGKVNTKATEIEGTWMQGAPLELNFHRGGIAARPAPKPATPSDIDGDWLATLDTSVGKLRMVLHVVNTEDGLTANMDSLDQNANGLQVTSMTRSGASLKFKMNPIAGSYDGTISQDLSTFSGTWNQAGKSWPLAFKRVKNANWI
jgi:hypothetical protein